MTAADRLEGWIEELRRAHSVRARLGLAVGECRIRVESDSEEVIGRLERYFRCFAPEATEADIVVTALEAPQPSFPVATRDWPRDPGKVGRKDEFVDLEDGRLVRKVRTGMHFLLGSTARVAVGPCLANLNQVVNFVNSQYISWLMQRGWLLCHAAGVVRGGRGLAIAGFSGGGKSTLALQLMSRGCGYVSNDRLLVRRDDPAAWMAGIPKLPRINPGTALHNPDLKRVLPPERRQALSQLTQEELWDLEEKYDVDVPRLFGEGRIELLAPLDGFGVLNWRRDADEPTRFRRVELAERADLLGAIMKAPGPFHRGPPERPAGSPPDVPPYLESLARVPIFEALGRADFAAAAEFCLRKMLPEGP